MDDAYFGFAVLVGGIAFIGIWIYAFVAWGFLIGLAIGWLPALIGGFILGLLWPLVLLVILVIGAMFLYSMA